MANYKHGEADQNIYTEEGLRGEIEEVFNEELDDNPEYLDGFTFKELIDKAIEQGQFRRDQQLGWGWVSVVEIKGKDFTYEKTRQSIYY